MEIPSPVVKGVHYTRKATHCVVGVSDFLMTSLAKLTVRVGKGVKEAVEDSEVGGWVGTLEPQSRQILHGQVSLYHLNMLLPGKLTKYWEIFSLTMAFI